MWKALFRSQAFQRFRNNRPAYWGLWLTLALLLFAIAGPVFVPHSPYTSDFSLSRDIYGAPPGPSFHHPLGTDILFRDLLSRLAHGTRLSLFIAIAATALSTAVGTCAGLLSGMSHGTKLSALDTLLMRLVDILLALPFLLFVTAVGVATRSSDSTTILLVLGLLSWSGTARLVRAKTLQLRTLDFITASRALGAGPLHIAFRHVLPNIATTLALLASTSVAQMILAEAVLSYLTVGVQAPQPSLGRMLHESEHYLGTRLSLVAAPGLIILAAVIGWNRIGEGLRDAFDPQGTSLSLLPKRRRIPFDVLLTGALILLVVASRPNRVAPPQDAGSGQAGENSPLPGGKLHLALSVNVRRLDPALAYDEAALVLEELLYARLVTWDEHAKIVPDLAKEVRVSPDGLALTFELREGLRFHDGTELLAQDVKRSMERALHPKSACPAASNYSSIEGFDAFREGKAKELSGLQIKDDRTLLIQLSQPDATFLPLLTMAFMAPVCASAGEFADAKNPPKPCGAGPFQLEAWEPDRSILFKKHQGYHIPGKPYLDAIEWSLNVRWSAQRYKFDGADLDYTRELSNTDGALYRADPAWTPYAHWSQKLAVYGLFMNTEMAPFDNVLMRRAVSFALDPSVLEKLSSSLIATDRVLPASLPGPARTTPMRVFDRQKALSLLAEAGYAFNPETRRGGYPHPIELVTVPGGLEQQVAEVFQEQLAQVGIRVELRLFSHPAYLANIARRKTVPMGLFGWYADFPDAANFFEPTLSSSAIADEGSQNYAFFSNADFDRLLLTAHREPNLEKRFALYEQAEIIVRDQAPWVPAYTVRSFEIWQPYVRGYVPHPILPQRFHDVWLAPQIKNNRTSSLSTLLPARPTP